MILLKLSPAAKRIRLATIPRRGLQAIPVERIDVPNADPYGYKTVFPRHKFFPKIWRAIKFLQ
jgi:hypothetical protein